MYLQTVLPSSRLLPSSSRAMRALAAFLGLVGATWKEGDYVAKSDGLKRNNNDGVFFQNKGDPVLSDSMDVLRVVEKDLDSWVYSYGDSEEYSAYSYSFESLYATDDEMSYSYDGLVEEQPTPLPTMVQPTPAPIFSPTAAPTTEGTESPTMLPTPLPTPLPTAFATSAKETTDGPSQEPTPLPTPTPTALAAMTPTKGTIVSGTIGLLGITVVEAEANVDVFERALALSVGVPTSTVTVEVSRRRRLEEEAAITGVTLKYEIATPVSKVSAIATTITSMSLSTFDAALVAAAEATGSTMDFSNVRTFGISYTTFAPTATPTTSLPTALPTPVPTFLPTTTPLPSVLPSPAPTGLPTSASPTSFPTLSPSTITNLPTPSPTVLPTVFVAGASSSGSKKSRRDEEASADMILIYALLSVFIVFVAAALYVNREKFQQEAVPRVQVRSLREIEANLSLTTPRDFSALEMTNKSILLCQEKNRSSEFDDDCNEAEPASTTKGSVLSDDPMDIAQTPYGNEAPLYVEASTAIDDHGPQQKNPMARRLVPLVLPSSNDRRHSGNPVVSGGTHKTSLYASLWPQEHQPDDETQSFRADESAHADLDYCCSGASCGAGTYHNYNHRPSSPTPYV